MYPVVFGKFQLHGEEGPGLAQVEALRALKERLTVEKDFEPFEEYRDKNGEIRSVIKSSCIYQG